MRVGFAGLGHMGLPMAIRLADGQAARDVWCGPDGLLAASPFLGYKREAYLADGTNPEPPVAFTA